MSSLALALSIYAQLAPHAPPMRAEVLTAAAASPRPAECRTLTEDDTPSAAQLWQRARLPRQRRYCALLAFGYARLVRAPADAFSAAQRAEAIISQQPATRVLEGRAAFALGRYEPAWQALSAASRASRRSVEAPGALHDLARAATATGHFGDALTAYRALVSRLDAVADPSERQRVYVEAAVVAMRAGPANLDESVAYANEARRVHRAPGLLGFVLGTLALALDRQGRADEAAGALNELPRAVDPQTDAKLAGSPFLAAAEVWAISALSNERTSRAAALAAWQEYLRALPEGPFVEHARGHVARLAVARSRGGGR